MLHPVPKGLKAQIGVIAEVADHAHVLPAAALDLEQLQTESAEGGGYPRAVSGEKTSGVYRPGVWEKQGDSHHRGCRGQWRAKCRFLGITT